MEAIPWEIASKDRKWTNLFIRYNQAEVSEKSRGRG
jgi:hypothetical protein